MPPEAFEPPDVLVLAAGGALGEAWMTGVLAGIEDATGHDFRRADAWIGTSAGSIVAAHLAAGESPRRPREGWDPADDAPDVTTGLGAAHGPGAGDAERPDDPLGGAVTAGPGRRLAVGLAGAAARWGGALTAPLVPTALAVGAPGGAVLRAALLARAPGASDRLRSLRDHVAETGARFDGRLRIIAVDRGSGRRVVFGAPGGPRAEVADAVQASCSVPWMFRPVEIGGRQYVDGGVWSLANLDVAPAGRGTRILCLHPTASLAIATATPFGVLRAAAATGTALEAVVVRRRGAQVRVVAPDAPAARIMAPNLMDGRRAGEVLRGGYAQGRALGTA